MSEFCREIFISTLRPLYEEITFEQSSLKDIKFRFKNSAQGALNLSWVLHCQTYNAVDLEIRTARMNFQAPFLGKEDPFIFQLPFARLAPLQAISR